MIPILNCLHMLATMLKQTNKSKLAPKKVRFFIYSFCMLAPFTASRLAM